MNNIIKKIKINDVIKIALGVILGIFLINFFKSYPKKSILINKIPAKKEKFFNFSSWFRRPPPPPPPQFRVPQLPSPPNFNVMRDQLRSQGMNPLQVEEIVIGEEQRHRKTEDEFRQKNRLPQFPRQPDLIQMIKDLKNRGIPQQTILEMVKRENEMIKKMDAELKQKNRQISAPPRPPVPAKMGGWPPKFSCDSDRKLAGMMCF
jgi:hypothetical protein